MHRRGWLELWRRTGLTSLCITETRSSAPPLMNTQVEAAVPAVDTGMAGGSVGRKLGRAHQLAGELIALVYIAAIAEIAYVSGAFYVLFPELGALSHDVFTRPRGTWASTPVLLAITPVLSGAIGIAFTRALPYGFVSVLLTVTGAVAIVLALKSPIAPAISAGLLPLVLGVKSWWYPPGILLGTVFLALLSLPWKRLTSVTLPASGKTTDEIIDDVVELVPAGITGCSL